ncbi:RRP36 [Sanghuangporus weigelae]
MKPPAKLSSKHGNPRKTKIPDIRDSRVNRHISRKERAGSATSTSDDDSGGDESEETVSNESENESELEIDHPRIAQWEEEEEDRKFPDTRFQRDKGEGSSKQTYNNNIASLSFGSLLKARRVLDRAHSEAEQDETDSSADSGEDKSIESSPERHESKKPGKRSHKHAPIEMSSKRPVTRRRQVVEVKKVNYRDPRFSSLSNDNAQQSFQKNYSFLAELHKTELETLKENLKRARNMLRSSPRDQREGWEEEVNRLERAYKRAESSVDRDRKDGVERQALEQARKEVKERRKDGKSEWHMKKSAKKELLLKARHDALAESGGRLAVRKAIEKRQKKINQKEKKRLPSFAGRGQHIDREGPRKRRKVVA